RSSTTTIIWWKKHTEHVIISFIFYYKRQECSMVLLLMDAHHSIGIQPKVGLHRLLLILYELSKYNVFLKLATHSFSRERKKKQFSLLLTKTNVKNTWRETEKKWMESSPRFKMESKRLNERKTLLQHQEATGDHDTKNRAQFHHQEQ
ncbi:hypothetical protein ACJX0J_035976, partial [Zea mays]